MFQRFFDIISRALAVNPIAGKEELLAQLNPDKIYVENVRSLLGVPNKVAVGICETAVRQGFFKRKVEVMCPDGVVAAEADTEEKLPPRVNCWIEMEGQLEQKEMPTDSLRKMIFYQLNEQATASLYGQATQNV